MCNTYLKFVLFSRNFCPFAQKSLEKTPFQLVPNKVSAYAETLVSILRNPMEKKTK